MFFFQVPWFEDIEILEFELERINSKTSQRARNISSDSGRAANSAISEPLGLLPALMGARRASTAFESDLGTPQSGVAAATALGGTTSAASSSGNFFVPIGTADSRDSQDDPPATPGRTTVMGFAGSSGGASFNYRSLSSMSVESNASTPRSASKNGNFFKGQVG